MVPVSQPTTKPMTTVKSLLLAREKPLRTTTVTATPTPKMVRVPVRAAVSVTATTAAMSRRMRKTQWKT